MFNKLLPKIISRMS